MRESAKKENSNTQEPKNSNVHRRSTSVEEDGEEKIASILSEVFGDEVQSEVLEEFANSAEFADIFDAFTSSLPPNGLTATATTLDASDVVDLLEVPISSSSAPVDDVGVTDPNQTSTVEQINIVNIDASLDIDCLSNASTAIHDPVSDELVDLTPRPSVFARAENSTEEAIKTETTQGTPLVNTSSERGEHRIPNSKKTMKNPDCSSASQNVIKIPKDVVLQSCQILLCDLKFGGKYFCNESKRSPREVKPTIKFNETRLKEWRGLEKEKRKEFISDCDKEKKYCSNAQINNVRKNVPSFSTGAIQGASTSGQRPSTNTKSVSSSDILNFVKEIAPVADVKNCEAEVVDVAGGVSDSAIKVSVPNKSNESIVDTPSPADPIPSPPNSSNSYPEKPVKIAASKKPHRPLQILDLSSTSDSDSEDFNLNISRKNKSKKDGKSAAAIGRQRSDEHRPKKFDKLENERLRKLNEKGKQTQKEKPPVVPELYDLKKEKAFSASFKIPKKTSFADFGPDKIVTPLATHKVPEENLKFETFKTGVGGPDFRPNTFHKSNNQNNSKNEFKNPELINQWKDAKRKDVQSHPEILNDDTPMEGPAFQDSFQEEDWDEPCVPDTTTTNEINVTPSVSRNEKVHKPEVPIKPPVAAPVAGPSPKVAQPKITEKSRTSTPSVEKSAKAPEVITIVDEDKDKASSLDAADPSVPLEQSQLKLNQLVVGVNALLDRNPNIEFPDIEDSPSVETITIRKCAWWFAEMAKDPPPKAKMDYPDELKIEIEPYAELNSDLESDMSDEEAECYPNPKANKKPVSESNSKLEEFVGRSILTAKIRISSTDKDNLDEIFYLRPGTDYFKPNFQAKCNLCSLLIVGRLQLALHVESIDHRKAIKRLDKSMGNKHDKFSPPPDDQVDGEVVNSPCIYKSKVAREDPGSKKDATQKTDRERKPPPAKDSPTNGVKSNSRSSDRDSKRNRGKDSKNEEPFPRRSNSQTKVKTETGSLDVETGVTSTGLTVKIPASCDPKRKDGSKSRSRTRSPRGRRRRSRSRSRSKRKSRSPRSRSRSPRRHRSTRKRSRSVHRIPRSPTHAYFQEKEAKKVPDKAEIKLAEDIEKFLTKTNSKRRSPSPVARHGSSKRSRRSRSRSKSPFSIKKDNKVFCEKLALTAEGKWTDELEGRWKLMEAEEAIFIEKLQESQRALKQTPESHPKYGEEWTAFWERRYAELAQSNEIDPEQYDYVSEWKVYWANRLAEMFHVEFETGLKNIRKAHGMDIETLQRLRAVPSPTPVVPQQPAQPVIDEEERNAKKQRIIEKFDAEFEASMREKEKRERRRHLAESSTTRNDVKNKEPPPKVTVADIQSKWASLIGQNQTQSSTRTSETGSTFDSEDFEELELVQVLKKMTKLEDHLSFLSFKVNDYIRKAEELEAQKKNKSYKLLNDEDFVLLLFQIRDRFSTMITAKISSRDVLDDMNLSVYALNSILETPQCQKFKRESATPSVNLSQENDSPILCSPIPNKENKITDSPINASPSSKSSSKPAAAKTNIENKGEPVIQSPKAGISRLDSSPSKESAKNKERQPNPISPTKEPKRNSAILGNIVNKLKDEDKNMIANVVADAIVTVGAEHIEDSELGIFLERFLSPAAKMAMSASSNQVQQYPDTGHGSNSNLKNPRNGSASFDHLGFQKNPPVTNSNNISSIADIPATKGVGKALPMLPTFNVRRSSTHDQFDYVTPSVNNEPRAQAQAGNPRQSPLNRNMGSVNRSWDNKGYENWESESEHSSKSAVDINNDCSDQALLEIVTAPFATYTNTVGQTSIHDSVSDDTVEENDPGISTPIRRLSGGYDFEIEDTGSLSPPEAGKSHLPPGILNLIAKDKIDPKPINCATSSAKVTLDTTPSTSRSRSRQRSKGFQRSKSRERHRSRKRSKSQERSRSRHKSKHRRPSKKSRSRSRKDSKCYEKSSIRSHHLKSPVPKSFHKHADKRSRHASSKSSHHSKKRRSLSPSSVSVYSFKSSSSIRRKRTKRKKGHRPLCKKRMKKSDLSSGGQAQLIDLTTESISVSSLSSPNKSCGPSSKSEAQQGRRKASDFFVTSPVSSEGEPNFSSEAQNKHGDAVVDGVSKTFWEDHGSVIESVSSISEKESSDPKAKDIKKPVMRIAPKLRISESIHKVDLEPGELSISSEDQ